MKRSLDLAVFHFRATESTRLITYLVPIVPVLRYGYTTTYTLASFRPPAPPIFMALYEYELHASGRVHLKYLYANAARTAHSKPIGEPAKYTGEMASLHV